MTLLLSCVLALLSLTAGAAPLQDVGFGWAAGFGNESQDNGWSIAVDDDGNVYTTGFFLGTVDFDPGPGKFNLVGNDVISSIFVTKMDGNGNLLWAKAMGGTGNALGYALAIDSAGNVYTTGRFAEIVDFDPGEGTAELTSAGESDIFVSKLNGTGDFVWAKRLGGFSDDQALGIGVDSAGNVYTSGQFQGSADFDPGTGTVELTSAGESDIFVSKLNGNGDFVWAKQIGGSDIDRAVRLAMDGAGNVHVTGRFAGSVDFDPGPGTANLSGNGSEPDSFVLKLDGDGNYVWAVAMGGTDGERGVGIAVDNAGNLNATGWFRGTADFDPGQGVFNLTSSGEDDVYVVKLNSSGNFVWAKNFGGPFSEEGWGITVDQAGNVYTTGSFINTADFDPGPGTFTLTAADSNIFVSKLDSSGEFVWAQQMVSSSRGLGLDIAVDRKNNVYTTGYFSGDTDFDPGSGSFVLSSPPASGIVLNENIFISKLTQSGLPTENRIYLPLTQK